LISNEPGFVIFFTGYSGAGKTTLAEALSDYFVNTLELPVEILDGDRVRELLCSDLGFSKEHRDLNIKRIGFVASLIARQGGIVLCAAIAPYDNARKEARNLVESYGGKFILVHVATSLKTCEHRDVKGLYAKARAGIIKEFTGISDPYEIPEDAELAFDTTYMSVDQCLNMLVAYLIDEGLLVSD
jgi:sulfate adenylyltransferase